MKGAHRVKVEGGFDHNRRLWAYAFLRAVLDLRLKTERESAARWFLSGSMEVGSFLWTADVLDLDPWRIRRKFLTRVY
jgi:hypothetical protein